MTKSVSRKPSNVEDAGRICFGAGWRLPSSKPTN